MRITVVQSHKIIKIVRSFLTEIKKHEQEAFYFKSLKIQFILDLEIKKVLNVQIQ